MKLVVFRLVFSEDGIALRTSDDVVEPPVALATLLNGPDVCIGTTDTLKACFDIEELRRRNASRCYGTRHDE